MIVELNEAEMDEADLDVELNEAEEKEDSTSEMVSPYFLKSELNVCFISGHG